MPNNVHCLELTYNRLWVLLLLSTERSQVNIIIELPIILWDIHYCELCLVSLCCLSYTIAV